MDESLSILVQIEDIKYNSASLLELNGTKDLGIDNYKGKLRFDYDKEFKDIFKGSLVGKKKYLCLSAENDDFFYHIVKFTNFNLINKDEMYCVYDFKTIE